MLMNLRSMSSMAALLGVVAVSGFAACAQPPDDPVRLRLAVFSDIHVTGEDWTADFWEAGLRRADAFRADGVLVCGDLADYGTDEQLEVVAKRWFRVFPDGRRSDGEPVANLLHYGDHDTSGYTYRGCGPCVKMYPDEEAMKKRIIRNLDRKALWERCFREPWAPIVKKTVKGYDFVLAHFTKGEEGNAAGDNVPGLEDFFAKLKIDPSKPLFYSQHRIPRHTANGPYAWGQDDGKTVALFSKYPNLVAFSGHHHVVASEEQSIWQGAFTSIQVPSLNYCCTLAGRDNSTHCEWDSYFTEPPLTFPGGVGWGKTRAGYFVTVHDHAIRIERVNLEDGGKTGPDWVIPLPLGAEKPYSHEYRAVHDPAPEFAAGAKVTMSKTHGKDCRGNEQDFYELSFPIAEATASTPRANDYEVTVELLRCDVVQTVDSHRVFSPKYGRALTEDTGPVICRVPVAKVPKPGFQRVRFAVRPVNSFGRKGAPIYLGFTQ